MFTIPLEIFFGFIGMSVFLTVIGLLTNPKTPLLIMIAGMFVFAQVAITDEIIMGFNSEIDDNISTIFNQQTLTGQTPIHNGSAFNEVIWTEHITTSSSQLFGKAINCMTIAIGKTGSPPITTEIILGVFSGTVSNSIAETKYEFGRVNTTNLTVDKMFFKRCNTNQDYTLITGDRIGIMYRAGNSTNNVLININTQNPYDGTISVQASFDDLTNVWTNNNANDLAQTTLTLEHESVIIDSPIIFEFTDLPKVLYGLYGAILMLIGGIVLRKEQ